MKIFKILIFLILFAAESAKAAITVAPVIIDIKGKAREILSESIILINKANYKTNIYAVVNDIAVKENRLSAPFANWIEFPRGVIELLPGEEKRIDFSININLRAEPGIYHASIIFPEGTTRYEAEARTAQAPSVMVNLEVVSGYRGELKLKKLAPAKTFFSGFPAAIYYVLENRGDQTLVPKGEVIIYNRDGEEVAVLPVNEGDAFLAPASLIQLSNIWADFDEFGRYKAYLRLEYGPGKTIQDSVFFWVLPWKKIFLIFGAISAVIILITHYSHRYYEK